MWLYNIDLLLEQNTKLSFLPPSNSTNFLIPNYPFFGVTVQVMEAECNTPHLTKHNGQNKTYFLTLQNISTSEYVYGGLQMQDTF